MRTITIQISGCDLAQETAQEIGMSIAVRDNQDSMVISRYNRFTNACSPCCLKEPLGDKPGWEVYGENHGGRLKIIFNQGEYVFIYS